jgi:hypothetical protein
MILTAKSYEYRKLIIHKIIQEKQTENINHITVHAILPELSLW